MADEYSLMDGDTRLCVTAEECNGRDRFTLYDKCLLPSECRAKNRYAYAVTGTCGSF